MSVQIFRAASRPVTQWRNGGGQTFEIARHPADAREHWWWRASVATITQDGAFSSFPGCDRILVPLDGSLRLNIAGTRREVPQEGVLRFRGEEDVRSVDVTRPTTDLNIIVARERAAADLTIGAAPGTRYLPARGQSFLVVALSDEVIMDTVQLAHLDAALLQAGQEAVIEKGLVAAIEITDLR